MATPVRTSPDRGLTQAARQRECMRRYRQRQRRGIQMLRVSVPPEVVEALLVAGRLDAAGSRDAQLVAVELGDVLQQWAAIWLRK